MGLLGLASGCEFHARSPEDYRSVTRALIETRTSQIQSCYDATLKTDKEAKPASLENLLERLNRQEFDLVAVGRALLVDADWALKVREGREQDILPFSREALMSLD